jgi:integrase/recombinase XerD
MTAASIDKYKLLRPVGKGSRLGEDGLSDWAVWSVVEQSAKQIGIEHFGAHDLRRTCAKLCWKVGGDLEQIKFLLGALLDPDHRTLPGLGAGDRHLGK